MVCFAFPTYALDPDPGGSRLIPLSCYCVLLLNGYIMLMLAKERSDRQIAMTRKRLEKNEDRFRRVVATVIEGILIFDEEFRITFANGRMASLLGYTTTKMLGWPYGSFFPENQMHVNRQQEHLRKAGEDSFTSAVCGERMEKNIGFWFRPWPSVMMRVGSKAPLPC